MLVVVFRDQANSFLFGVREVTDSSTVIDWLIAVYERLRPYHTPSVLLLVLAILANFVVELPIFIWAVFVFYFGISLAGNMAKQRRESPYA